MSTMFRVDRAKPCIVCKKSDWCVYGKDVAICMRVPSSRPKTFSDGSMGWLHSRDGSPLPTLPPKPPVIVSKDSNRIVLEWRAKWGTASLDYLAKTLAVTKESLEMLGCVKAPQHAVWGFPMHDGKGFIIGIRMRHENGRKWCEPGGHNGLFLPLCIPTREVVICEGPTDTAAALSIGLFAIGRFNCCGGIGQIQEYIKRLGIKRATIVADVDQDRKINGNTINPGIQGAIALGEVIGIPSRCVTLPTKDMREFVAKGGTAEHFQAIASQNVWNK